MDCKRAAPLLEAYLDNELDRAEAGPRGGVSEDRPPRGAP